MKEKNEKVFKDILSKAFVQTTEKFSFMIDLQNGDDKLNLSLEDYFEDTMANIQLMSENSTEKSTACAAAFALHSINLAAQTRDMHNRIDNFFANADNQDWLKENGVGDDEKSALCQELKDFISNELKIKTSTKEEKEFVEKINAVFDIGKEEQPADYLKHTLDFFSDVNKYLQNDYKAKDALNAAYNDLSFIGGGNKITDAIFDNIPALSNSIEKEAVDEYMKDISANYIEENEVNAGSFSEHYSAAPDALTPDEKEWAHNVYCKMLYDTLDPDNGYDLSNVKHTSFVANGEQIISNEEFENAKDKNGVIAPEKLRAMEEKIAAKAASGEQITVRKFVPEKSVDIKPANILLKNNSGMSFRIFNEHYKSNPDRLTKQDIEWANEAFDNIIRSIENAKSELKALDVDMSGFYANGKQIITRKDYENARNEQGVIAPEKESEMKLKIAAKLAAGDKITVRRTAPEKPLAFDVTQIKQSKRSEPTINSRVEEKTNSKSIFEQTGQPNNVIKFSSEKDQPKKKPMSFSVFLSKLFQRLHDALTELGRTRESKAKAGRTKTNFIELMEIDPHTDNKNLPKEKVNDKTLTKKGKTL